MRSVACVSLVVLIAMAGCSRGGRDETGLEAGTSRTDDARRAASETGAPEAEGADRSPTAPAQGYNVREGRALYVYYCATCHGDEGHGDGLNAYNLDPKPRDLAAAEFQRQGTDDDLMGVIRSGGGVAGLSTAMPPWGRTLGERKIRNIVDYLRTLREAAD